MPVSSYSTTAASNTSVGGTNIGEGCPPGNVNDGLRAIMADIASWYASFTVPTITTTGNVSIGGTLSVTGTSSFTGAATFAGNVTLGDAGTDSHRANGFLGINCASSVAPLRVQTAGSNSGFEVQTDGGGPLLLAYDRVAGAYQDMEFYAAAYTFGNGAPTSFGGNVSVTGNITASGTITGSSDETLKTNIRPIENASAIADEIEGFLFDWLASGDEDAGVIAQQVLKVFPQAVKANPETGKLAVSPLALIGLLFAARKEDRTHDAA